MDTITKNAYAKINLTLDVISKLPNGYHELNMIMQQISMHDVITISKTKEKGVFLNCNKKIGEVKDNIVYKACMLMIEKYDLQEGVKVNLEKNIFLAAGLAGGSTDCATAILCMNELFDLNLSLNELMEIGGTLGKDVVYCIHRGLCFATGDGTNLEQLKDIDKAYVVVANPNIEVSTKYVFENFKFLERVKTDYYKMFKAIEENDINKIACCFNNQLETVTIEKYPIIGYIKEEIKNSGAINSLMSGSGATVFGYFDSEEAAIKCNNILKEKFDGILSEVCFTI